MSDPQEIQLLTEIKAELSSINKCLCVLRTDMQTDRAWIWKILALTIAGAFAIIGVKIVFP